jgi:glycosyltransferase involved in cell wall biosynthesis
MKISAAIITNKEDLNQILLRSLSFADEIIVIVDSNKAQEKATDKKIKYYSHPLNGDFSAQRNFALKQSKNEWVLFVDDDEYVGTELAREIELVLEKPKHSGYSIPRVDVVYHQPLLHGETGKIRILRLGKKTAGSFERSVHEVWKIKGGVGELRSPLYHSKNHFVSEFIGRMSHYGKIDAKILISEGKPFTWSRLIFNPILKFKFNYFFRAGFLDGLVGLFLAYLMAVQSLSVRVFQWENQK